MIYAGHLSVLSSHHETDKAMKHTEDKGGPIPSDSFTGLISYNRLLSCRHSDGAAVGPLVRG